LASHLPARFGFASVAGKQAAFVSLESYKYTQW